jgi:hypothetical protein
MHLQVKEKTRFGTAEEVRGPLEVLFRQLDFKPLVFGTFAESSPNVKDYVEMAVEYGVEHLGTSMAASPPNVLRVALRRRFRAQLSLAAWRGYANFVREGPAANTNLMARCQIPQVNMANPVLYCTVAYGMVALNLSTR